MAEPSATYGNDPENSPLDKVRLLVGDTVCETAYLTDQEIQMFLSQYGDACFAAPPVARTIAAKLARKVSQNAGGVSQNLSDLFKHYTELAKHLLQCANENLDSGAVWAGGLSVAEKQTDRVDADLVQPYFERGQMHNPDATTKPDQGDLSGRET